ncbi:hypothetical protein GMSM_30880 [Geomonas sp. Red276]
MPIAFAAALVLQVAVLTGAIFTNAFRGGSDHGVSNEAPTAWVEPPEAFPPSPPEPISSTQEERIGPRIVQPVTGGAPEIAIPLGGGMYQPVTGGAPVVGVPLD